MVATPQLVRAADEPAPAASLEEYLRLLQQADEALRDGNPSRARVFLYQCPEALRSWEWHYLSADARPPIKQPIDLPRGLRFAPDGKTIAVLSRDTVRIHQAERGTLIRKIQVGDDTSRVRDDWKNSIPPDALAFSPDGKWLAFGGNKSHSWGRSYNAQGQAASPAPTRMTRQNFFIWDWKTGRRPQILGSQHRLHSIDFAPDGKVFCSSSEIGEIAFWSAAASAAAAQNPLLDVAERHLMTNGDPDDKPAAWLLADTKPTIISADVLKLSGVQYVRFSPDGNKLAWFRGNLGEGTSGPLYISDVRKLAERIEIPFQGSARALEYAPSGKTILLCGMDLTERGEGNHLHLFDSQTGAVVQRGFRAAECTCAVFTPDGKRVVTVSPESIDFWEATTLKHVFALRLATTTQARLAEPNQAVFTSERTLGISTDLRFLAMVTNSELRIWDTLAKRSAN